METLKFENIKNWEQIEYRGQIITNTSINDTIRQKFENLKFVHMDNENYMELSTYEIVIAPMEETRSKINDLSMEEKTQLNNFISNLRPRDGQPKHSDLWAQTKDFTINHLPMLNGDDVTNMVEMFERKMPIMAI